MKNYFLDDFNKTLEDNLSVENVLKLMENTNFFLKILRVKFESGNPELIQQAAEELKQMKEFLTSIELNKKIASSN